MSPINSAIEENVTREEVRRLEDDPALILAIVDLIFMGQDAGDVLPS